MQEQHPANARTTPGRLLNTSDPRDFKRKVPRTHASGSSNGGWSPIGVDGVGSGVRGRGGGLPGDQKHNYDELQSCTAAEFVRKAVAFWTGVREDFVRRPKRHWSNVAFVTPGSWRMH